MNDQSANYQAEVKRMLGDLKDSLSHPGIRWNDWERQFIRNVIAQLQFPSVNISKKQYTRICELWEKSLK